MRKAWIDGAAQLKQRIAGHRQLEAPVSDAQMPSYLESFLAHLRVLVGVPFDYLVPDARLLPIESIRFFYLDRSFTDRMVDGAIAVGKVGTREEAHHQACAHYVSSQLDLTERQVRDLQRGRARFEHVAAQPIAGGADVVTGFLLRSRAVSGWPHMDVRAYRFPAVDSEHPAPGFDPAADAIASHQLRTLRLERLAPGVLIALFEGVPNMVMCEEPHHGVQLGVNDDRGKLTLLRRDGAGIAITGIAPEHDIEVPLRPGGLRVIHVAELKRRLEHARTGGPGVPASPQMPVQDGAGNFAIALLDRPWRQRFQAEGGQPRYHGTGHYVAELQVAVKTIDPTLESKLGELEP